MERRRGAGRALATRVCAEHSLAKLHAARSRGAPTLPALDGVEAPSERGNLSGETTIRPKAYGLVLYLTLPFTVRYPNPYLARI